MLTRQGTFDFRVKSHGGARPGAGRPKKKESERAKGAPLPHRGRPSHRKGDPVHVTVRVGKGVPSLRAPIVQKVVRAALLAQRKRLQGIEARFQIVHFSIQTDHVHLIAEASDKRTLGRGIAGLEVRIARGVNKLLRRTGRFWSDRYHRHDLRTPTETRHALRYVLLNLQKHHRVIGDRAFADPRSSASTFDGFTRPPATFDDELAWPRVPPRTWLLSTGWRRRGLIDPAIAPLRPSPRR